MCNFKGACYQHNRGFVFLPKHEIQETAGPFERLGHADVPAHYHTNIWASTRPHLFAPHVCKVMIFRQVLKICAIKPSTLGKRDAANVAADVFVRPVCALDVPMGVEHGKSERRW